MQKLRAVIGVFWVNTICTLKCKQCITLTPYHKKAENFSKERIFADIDNFFEIYEWVEHFDVEGGETLLHPDLPEIIKKAFEYKNCFRRFHILTNGTIMPSKELLEVCKEVKDVFFIIDDYGPELSKRAEEIKQVLKENKIDFRVDMYHGDNQYYGGWVDFGDMKYKDYSDEELKKVFQNCRAGHNKAPYIKNGKMFLCPVQGAGIKYITLKDNEFVDFCSEKTIQEQIEIAAAFGEHPTSACAYCKGFDAENGKRYKAAKQISKNLTEEEKYAGN